MVHRRITMVQPAKFQQVWPLLGPRLIRAMRTQRTSSFPSRSCHGRRGGLPKSSSIQRCVWGKDGQGPLNHPEPTSKWICGKTFRNAQVHFTHRGDFLPLVAAQQNAFDRKASEARELDLDELPACEIDILADSLQSFRVLQQLKLTNCRLDQLTAATAADDRGDRGFRAFVRRLCWIPSLKKVGGSLGLAAVVFRY